MANLKLSSSATLSIVPYWNWKRLSMSTGWSSASSQSYLIGIESFKRNAREFFMALSIVPYWNWKSILAYASATRSALSIVPYWNWKMPRSGLAASTSGSQSYLIGIESHQLWNIDVQVVTLNRTLLELKDATSADGSQGFSLSIVPYWNWKKDGCGSSPTRRALNRTLLELKGDRFPAYK